MSGNTNSGLVREGNVGSKGSNSITPKEGLGKPFKPIRGTSFLHHSNFPHFKVGTLLFFSLSFFVFLVLSFFSLSFLILSWVDLFFLSLFFWILSFLCFSLFCFIFLPSGVSSSSCCFIFLCFLVFSFSSS